MTNFINFISSVLLLLFITGCSTPGYFIDRGRDASDIFTAAIGVGGGAKTRVGPFSTGLIASFNYMGLQDGDTFYGFGESGDENGADGFIIWGSELSNQRNKYYLSSFLVVPMPPPCGDAVYNKSFFTQIDAVIGLGGTIKLGFNPGEFIDFILGWVSIDIYEDDIGIIEKENIEP